MSRGDSGVCKTGDPADLFRPCLLNIQVKFRLGIKHTAVCLYGTSVAEYNGNPEYHYGGYGRVSWPLSRFIVVLEMKHGAVLVYSFKQPGKYIIHIYVHSPCCGARGNALTDIYSGFRSQLLWSFAREEHISPRARITFLPLATRFSA